MRRLLGVGGRIGYGWSPSVSFVTSTLGRQGPAYAQLLCVLCGSGDGCRALYVQSQPLKPTFGCGWAGALAVFEKQLSSVITRCSRVARFGATGRAYVFNGVPPKRPLWHGTYRSRWIQIIANLSRFCHESALTVWVQPARLVQKVQVLALSGLDGAGTAEARCFSTLIFATSTLVGAALGYTRRYRRVFFLQQCLFKHLRRYLLLLLPHQLELQLLGVMPRFRACWRTLNQATNEVFLHPITNSPVYDAGLVRRQLSAAGGGLGCLKVLHAALTDLAFTSVEEKKTFFTQFEKDVERALCDAYGRAVGWQRYEVRWVLLHIRQTHGHGQTRHCRARSIKRRRAKKLVKQTKFRF